MNDFAIVCDSTANLKMDYIKENSLTVIPYSYYVDGEELISTDPDDFDAAGLYGSMRAGKVVTTSQITPERYRSYMGPVLEEGRDILYISMSSGISGSYNSCRIAAEELREAYPERKILTVDSLGASLGCGLWVMTAVDMKRSGRSMEDICSYIEEHKKNMYQVFTVEDLKYLTRSGRLSNAKAIIGNLLHIKPILKGNEKGQIVSTEKIRGRANSIKRLAAKFNELSVEPLSQIVGIAHADCEKEAQGLADMLKAGREGLKVLTVMYEPVTGSHVGPGTIALFFLGADDVRSR